MIIFGVGTMYGTPLTNAAGVAVTNPLTSQMGVLQEVQGDFSFDEKTLYGAYQDPVAFGRGKGKKTFKAKVANLSAQAIGNLFFGIPPTAGIQATSDNEAHTGATTITIAPPSSGTYLNDLGVVYATTGIPLTPVTSGPAVGQYSVNTSTGVYTFNASDVGAALLISYEYTATSTSAYKIGISNQLMGYAPTVKVELSLPFNGHQANIHLNQCIFSKLTLPFKNEDFSVQEMDWTCIADASGNIGTYSLQ
jgi:hypothetical protein